MRRIHALIMCLGLAMLIGCGPEPTPSGAAEDVQARSQADESSIRRSPRSVPTVMPVITMWNGGIPMAGVDPYLLYAVWEDGTVMVTSPQPPGTGIRARDAILMVGKVDPARVEALLQACEQAGAFDSSGLRTCLYPDGPWLRTSIRYKGQHAVLDYHGRDEWEGPENDGPHAGRDRPEVRAFIKLWREVEGGIQALTPTPRTGYNEPSPLELPMAVDILGPLPIEAAQRVRSVLPNGWTLTMTGGGFEVRRQAPVEWFNTIGLPTWDMDELKAGGYVRLAIYTIRAGVAEPAPEFLAHMQRHNEQARRRMQELDAQMAHMRGRGEYEPRTPADRELVDEYERLKVSPYRLPDVTTAEWSVWFRPSLFGNQAFYSPEVEQECATVRQAIEAALSGP